MDCPSDGQREGFVDIQQRRMERSLRKTDPGAILVAALVQVLEFSVDIAGLRRRQTMKRGDGDPVGFRAFRGSPVAQYDDDQGK